MDDHTTAYANERLPLAQRRLLAGACTRCGAAGPHETNECGDCAKSAVQRNRARRAKLRDEGKCVRCRRRSKTYRCRRCEKKKQRQRPGQLGARLGHAKTDSIANTKLEVRTESDGYQRTRVRYTGRSQRGAPSRAQLAFEQVRNIKFAKRELDKIEAAITAATAVPRELPMVQRQGAWQEVLGLSGFAFRLLEEIEDFAKAQIKRLPSGKRTVSGDGQ